jgi:hypothetical protein
VDNVRQCTQPPITRFAPPDEAALAYFGRGIDPAQAKALQQSEHVVLLRFVLNERDWLPHHRAAMELMLALAKQTGGLSWDDATRELFAPAEWEKRITPWIGEYPKSCPYIRYRADGREEGNETGKLIFRRQSR